MSDPPSFLFEVVPPAAQRALLETQRYMVREVAQRALGFLPSEKGEEWENKHTCGVMVNSEPGTGKTLAGLLSLLFWVSFRWTGRGTGSAKVLEMHGEEQRHLGYVTPMVSLFGAPEESSAWRQAQGRGEAPAFLVQASTADLARRWHSDLLSTVFVLEWRGEHYVRRRLLGHEVRWIEKSGGMPAARAIFHVGHKEAAAGGQLVDALPSRLAGALVDEANFLGREGNKAEIMREVLGTKECPLCVLATGTITDNKEKELDKMLWAGNVYPLEQGIAAAIFPAQKSRMSAEDILEAERLKREHWGLISGRLSELEPEDAGETDKVRYGLHVTEGTWFGENPPAGVSDMSAELSKSPGIFSLHVMPHALGGVKGLSDQIDRHLFQAGRWASELCLQHTWMELEDWLALFVGMLCFVLDWKKEKGPGREKKKEESPEEQGAAAGSSVGQTLSPKEQRMQALEDCLGQMKGWDGVAEILTGISRLAPEGLLSVFDWLKAVHGTPAVRQTPWKMHAVGQSVEKALFVDGKLGMIHFAKNRLELAAMCCYLRHVCAKKLAEESGDAASALTSASRMVVFVNEPCGPGGSKMDIPGVMRDRDVRVILGTYQAIGVGHNFQDKADHAVLYTFPEKASDVRQAVARIYRMGQKLPVTIEVFTSTNAKDQTTFSRVDRKNVLSILMEGAPGFEILLQEIEIEPPTGRSSYLADPNRMVEVFGGAIQRFCRFFFGRDVPPEVYRRATKKRVGGFAGYGRRKR